MATVPYELKGWSEGVDLSKEDSKKLEKEVLMKMEEIKKIYENKDIEGIAKLQYGYLKEYYQSMYFTEKKHSDEWLEEIKSSLQETDKFHLVNNNEMVLMGNGKLVSF